MLNFMLVSNKQIAIGTIATGVIQRDQVQWVDMNEQGDLALASFVLTEWTTGKSFAGIRVENKVVLGRLLAKLWLFDRCHTLLPSHYKTKINVGATVESCVHSPVGFTRC